MTTGRHHRNREPGKRPRESLSTYREEVLHDLESSGVCPGRQAEGRAVLVICPGCGHGVLPVWTLPVDEIETLFSYFIEEFMDNGCLLVLYSCLLSRSIEGVRSDGDESTSLLDRHGYANQSAPSTYCSRAGRRRMSSTGTSKWTTLY